MRLRLHRGREYPHRGPAMGQARAHRRNRARGVGRLKLLDCRRPPAGGDERGEGRMREMLNRRGIRRIAAVGAVLALAFAGGLARAADPITIGFGMALTGPLAANGKMSLLAMKIWEEDVNAKGGLNGRPVKLIYYDDQSSPSTIPGIYTKLL